MRSLVALLAFFASTVFAMGTVYTFPPCPASGPPPLPASGTSPDGDVCLNQQVRDDHGTVWQPVVAPVGYAQKYALMKNGVRLTGVSGAKMKGGQFQWTQGGSPAWGYWDYDHNTVWTVGLPIPPAQPPQPPAPPGTA